MLVGRNHMFAKQYFVWALLAANNILQQQYYICLITIGQ